MSHGPEPRHLGARAALALALALAGCVAPGDLRPVVPGASASPKAGASQAPRASAKPGSPAPAASATPDGKGLVAAAARLVRPLEGGVRLTGRIRADATYLRTAAGLIGADGGTLIGNDGGTLIGADGGTLVAAGAGNIVAAGAGNAVAVTGDDLAVKGGVGIVAAGAGNIVAAGGGNLIGADGATLIGNDGGTLIGNDGGTLIGNDGGTLIGNDGGTYRLAQAAQASAAPPAAGDQAAVAGMLVSVVSLAKREYLPVGETADGKPVYTVYADAAGGFALTIPPTEDASVMVVASLPGRTEAGTVLNALTPPASEVAVDEDTATVTRYLRRAMVDRMADVVHAPSLDEARAGIARDKKISDGARPIYLSLAEAFHALGQERGLPGLADRALARTQARALTAAVIDDALSRLEVGEIVIDPAVAKHWADPTARLAGFPAEGAKAQDALLAVFRELRGRGARAMAAGAGYKPLPPEFFARVAVGTNPEFWTAPDEDFDDWFTDVFERYPSDPYPLAKPAELGDFLVDRYFGVNRNFISEPPLAAFILLDPKSYEPDTRFPAAGEPYHAEATAMLPRINAAFAARGLPAIGPNDPQFNGWAREANRPFVEAINAAGFAYFMQVGLAVTADPARARAVATAAKLPEKAE